MPDTLNLRNSGNLFLTRALGHPRSVLYADGKEYPPNPFAIESSGYYSKEALPMYDANRKGMPVVIDADAVAHPITDYDTYAAFLAAAQADGATAGFIDGVRRLKGCNMCNPPEGCGGAVAFNEADVLVDLVTPAPLTGKKSFTWAVDANRGKVHPFAGELSATAPDGETYFPVVKWFGDRSAVQTRVVVRVRFDFANQVDKTP